MGELTPAISRIWPCLRAAGVCERCRAENSFCVALFEALWGHPPIRDGSSTGKQLHDSDGAAVIPRPTMGDVPKWLTSAILRGLAYRPDDRFPDMAALLHELTRDRRRPYIAGALVFASVLLGGLAASVLARPPDPLATCLAGQVEIDALAGPGDRLARHIAAWKAAHTIACRDTHRGSKPDTLLARRQLCLGQGRKTLASLLGQAPTAERERLVGELPPPANCLDEGLGRVAIPHDPVTRDRVARVDDLLAESEAGRMLGNYAAAAGSARAAVTAAEAAHHLPAVARAQFALGHLERLRDRRDAAQAALLLATTAASRSEDLALAVDAWHELAALAVLGEDAVDTAEIYLQLAANLLPAVHQGAEPSTASAAVQERMAEHADVRGLVAYANGELADAIVRHTDAIVGWRRLTDVTDVRGELAASLLDRGRARSDTGDHAAAIADYTEALQLELGRFGADHPSLAANHRALGQEYLELSDYPAAEREAQRALAIDTAHAAATDTAHDLQLLAKISLDAGQPELAAQRIAATQEAIARNPGASPMLRADADYFAAYVAAGRDDPAAETLWARAAAAYANVPGARAACQQANALIQRGHLALLADRPAEAAEAADQADVVLRRAGDLGCHAGAGASWLRGRILLVREDHAGALRHLEDAAARTPASEAIRADILDDLAHTLHALDRDPVHLREIVAEAQRHYEGRNLHAEAESLARLLVSPPAHPR
jgi:tetratricopeptide (TPR) repeat protein